VSGRTALARFLTVNAPVLVISGAGSSVRSGIPDYRDATGRWKRPQPVQHRDFMTNPSTRKRYWARSLAGWPAFATAMPNGAHHALARLEARGVVGGIVTQNVDRLHQRAGSTTTLDLHGRIDRVRCMDCGRRCARAALQARLSALNPAFAPGATQPAPDGDADLDPDIPTDGFVVPDCPRCGGVLKPDVVFYGDSVPRERVDEGSRRLEQARGLLAVGTSLMVYSAFRMFRRARELALPMAAVNLGRTRADGWLDLHVAADCTDLLPVLAEQITHD
jgi:NAD-dependent SIR2 family protein deacetylase